MCKISADFLPAGSANNLPCISQIFYVGGGFSRPTLHPAHPISANFQRTKQLFVQQELVDKSNRFRYVAGPEENKNR